MLNVYYRRVGHTARRYGEMYPSTLSRAAISAVWSAAPPHGWGQTLWWLGAASKHNHDIAVQCHYSPRWASRENTSDYFSACDGAAKARCTRPVESRRKRSEMALSGLFRLDLTHFSYPLSNRFFKTTKSIASVSRMWSFSQSLSHFLPRCSLLPLLLVSPSFTVCPFHFTSRPLCDPGSDPPWRLVHDLDVSFSALVCES